MVYRAFWTPCFQQERGGVGGQAVDEPPIYKVCIGALEQVLLGVIGQLITKVRATHILGCTGGDKGI